MKQGSKQVRRQKETPLAGRLAGDAISGGVGGVDHTIFPWHCKHRGAQR